MSAITIIASADHGTNGTSAAVDVSNFSTLRLNLTIASLNESAKPSLDVTLETSSDQASWAPLHEFRSMYTTGTQRVILSNHDNYVRLRWTGRCMDSAQQPNLVWGLTGEGKPDAG